MRKINRNLLVLILALSSVFAIAAGVDNPLINSSRNSCVRIIVPSIDSSGTGFFIDGQHLVTCFHVVGRSEVNQTTTPPEATINVAKDIKIRLVNGEEVEAECIVPSLPATPIKLQDPLPANLQNLLSPVINDFAVLQLKSKPKMAISPVPLFKAKNLPPIGSEVMFSGFPLGAPDMITHKGYISCLAPDEKIICIQAAINKGNSGGALLNEKAEVIGIVSAREGRIPKGLSDLSNYIENTKRQGQVRIMGVDQLAVTQELIRTLDTYISTGIGYARTIKFLQEYLVKNPLK